MRTQSDRMNDVTEFIIRSPKYGDHTVVIDTEDMVRVLKHTWCVSYKSRTNKIQGVRTTDWKNRKTIHLHRLVSGFGFVDHINGNVLDNRKCNLRGCTDAENCRNRKMIETNKYGYKGVMFDRRRNKWRARVICNYRRLYSSYCGTKEEAAEEYNKMAIKYFGNFARLNIIKEGRCEVKVS